MTYAAAENRFLNKLSKFAQSIERDFDDVNHGGCCIVAALLGKQIRKIFPQTRVLVAMSDWYNPVDVDTTRTKLKDNTHNEWNKNGVHFSHVLLEIEHNGYTYQLDTNEGLIERRENTMSGYVIQKGYLTIEEAERLGNQPAGWSSCFDRKQLPAIKKAINDWFKHNGVEA